MSYHRASTRQRRALSDFPECMQRRNDWVACLEEGNTPAATTAQEGGDPNAVAITTTAADFDATKIPGTCKPRSFPVLNLVQELQRQLNRVAHVQNLTKVAVDGDLGPATMALFTKVQAGSGGKVMGNASKCMGVAPDIDVIMPQVRQLADTLGAPATVSGPAPAAPPSIVGADGSLKPKPSSGILASIDAMPLGSKLVLAASVSGIIYMLATGPKRRRRARRR